nr:hypothetical protein [Candidatus Sigynarchaeota archaeon]
MQSTTGYHRGKNIRLLPRSLIIAFLVFPGIILGSWFIYLTDSEKKSIKCTNGIATAQSSMPPTSNQPANQRVLLDQAGVTITWQITDPDNASGLYIIIHDQDLNDLSSQILNLIPSIKTWYNNSAIVQQVDTSIAGNHNYTIFFTDMTIAQLIVAGMSAGGNMSTVWIAVETPLTIQIPSELRIHHGDVGKTLDFTIQDPDSPTGIMNVTENGSTVLGPNVQWNASQLVQIALNSSIPCYLNYTITATDGNYTRQVSSLVWIADSFPPQITGLMNQTVSPEVHDLTVQFTITDMENATGNYSVYRDSLPFNNSYTNATWTNGTAITLYLSLPGAGLVLYRVVAEDLTRNQTSETFSVYINSPPGINSPPNATYYYLSPTQNITWIIHDSDDASGNYTVLRNGTVYSPELTNQPWTNGTQINVTAYTTVIGLWNYTIIFSDGTSTRQDTTIITIVSPPIPVDDTTAMVILLTLIGAGFIGMVIILVTKSKKS